MSVKDQQWYKFHKSVWPIKMLQMTIMYIKWCAFDNIHLGPSEQFVNWSAAHSFIFIFGLVKSFMGSGDQTDQMLQYALIHQLCIYYPTLKRINLQHKVNLNLLMYIFSILYLVKYIFVRLIMQNIRNRSW